MSDYDVIPLALPACAPLTYSGAYTTHQVCSGIFHSWGLKVTFPTSDADGASCECAFHVKSTFSLLCYVLVLCVCVTRDVFLAPPSLSSPIPLPRASCRRWCPAPRPSTRA
jgi:hypothetical protein